MTIGINALSSFQKKELYEFIQSNTATLKLQHRLKELGIKGTRTAAMYILDNMYEFFHAFFIKTTIPTPKYYTPGEDYGFTKEKSFNETKNLYGSFYLREEWKITPFTYPEEEFDKNKYYELVGVDPMINNEHLIIAII